MWYVGRHFFQLYFFPNDVRLSSVVCLLWFMITVVRKALILPIFKGKRYHQLSSFLAMSWSLFQSNQQNSSWKKTGNIFNTNDPLLSNAFISLIEIHVCSPLPQSSNLLVNSNHFSKFVLSLFEYKVEVKIYRNKSHQKYFLSRLLS